MSEEIRNPPSSIFFQPDFWKYVHGKPAEITYFDGTILRGLIRFNNKKERFPMIVGATIERPGEYPKWLGDAEIDMERVKKVEVA